VDSTETDFVPDPKGSFDYSSIAPHPRLLLKSGEEEKIKANIESSPLLKEVHRWILNYCDDLMGKPFSKYNGGNLASESRNIERNLFFLAYAYRMTHNNQYLVRAITTLNNVCAFPDWNPDRFLSVAEFSMGVSLAYDWLFEYLDEDTRTKVRKA